jgi:hypothetical protein
LKSICSAAGYLLNTTIALRHLWRSSMKLWRVVIGQPGIRSERSLTLRILEVFTVIGIVADYLLYGVNFVAICWPAYKATHIAPSQAWREQ